MKKFIKEKYADIILQLAWKYKNENPAMKGSETYAAMDKTLVTMDKYVAWINNMGFMMYDESIKQMLEYISRIKNDCLQFSLQQLDELYTYLQTL